jgi:hypothetical protein
MKTVLSLLLVCVCAGVLSAQTPVVTSPVGIDLGIGGGISVPSGDLSDALNTGWNAGAKLRVKSVLPLNITGGVAYHRLPEKAGTESDAIWMVGGGLEYSLPGVGVSPYLGGDVSLNMFKNSGSGTSSYSRGGIGLGGGVLFSLPGFGSFDASVKYQMLNAIGKEALEKSANQIAASITLMATIL